MSGIIAERMTAEIEGDFVVFLIGMRVNKWWKFTKWIPTARAMQRMLAELEEHPESGCLGTERTGKLIWQYWRSFDDLEAYAKSKDQEHWPAWVAFNKQMNQCREDVGIWHETFLVRAGEYECVYSGMPEFGLGRATTLVPAVGSKESARDRLRAGETADVS